MPKGLFISDLIKYKLMMNKHGGYMKGNRLVKIISVLFLLLCFTACNKKEETEISFTAGTCETTVEGRNGPMELSVTFSETRIEEIIVVSHSETEGIADPAIERVPSDIITYQSLGIDMVSGATITSEAILVGVEACVVQQGGNVEALKAVSAEKPVSTEVIELNTDVVVVGGGAAGMTATIRSAELGNKVILVEKTSSLGGAAAVSGGNQVVMGSELQKEEGVTNDSVDSMVEDFLENGNQLNVPELLTLFAEHVGETTDWLGETAGVNYVEGLHTLSEYSYNRELAYEGGGSGFAQTMTAAIAATDAEVYLNTQAKELMVNEAGEVVGVIAVAEDGTTYKISAKAVILATGGYGNNDELLSDELKSALYYGLNSSTGDGIVMATVDGIDADVRLMEYGKRYPNGVEVSEGQAKSTIAGNIVAWKMSGILVNAEGSRVVNEQASNREILEVELEQTNQMLYLLLDEQTFGEWKTKLTHAGISEADIEKYLANDGSTTPVFLQADSLEELATKIGMDSNALVATVEKYNMAVTSGVDSEFGRPAEFMTMEIGDGPYYLIEQKPRFATTMGGLVVNTSLEVQNTSGETIKGLYAAGETVGGVMGDDSPSGANNAWAVTSGKLAAEAASKIVGE